MTDRERRGGPRAPDGVPRPQSLPFSRGPNRSDLSELPGSPGSTPPPLMQPTVRQGQAGPLREILGTIPLDRAVGAGGLFDETRSPDEPITSGASLGEGPGPEGLIPAQDQLNEQLESEELRYAFPLILRLSTMPRATTASKILAQRIRANMIVAPEQMPLIEHEGSLPSQAESTPVNQPAPIPEVPPPTGGAPAAPATPPGSTETQGSGGLPQAVPPSQP